MANLPSSGPLSLVQIGTFFNGPTPYSLRDYYRGGAYVPDIPANANIPTSGPISILDFYGASTFDPSITTNLWWANRASFIKTFGNTSSGDDTYRNTRNSGPFGYYPIVDNTTSSGGGGG